MPCIDPHHEEPKGSGYWQTQMADYQRRVQFAEAALCGVLRAIKCRSIAGPAFQLFRADRPIALISGPIHALYPVYRLRNASQQFVLAVPVPSAQWTPPRRA